MSQSQVFNPNPNPNSTYDSLRSGHSVFTTSSLGTLGTAGSAFGTVNSGYLPSTSRSMGRARGVNVGSLQQMPIREEPSPNGSHEDSSATTAMGNGIGHTAEASLVSGLFSPQTQRAINDTRSTNVTVTAPKSERNSVENSGSPYQNSQMVGYLPPSVEGKFVSDAFLTSENQRPEVPANTSTVSWALSPQAVRHVRVNFKQTFELIIIYMHQIIQLLVYCIPIGGAYSSTSLCSVTSTSSSSNGI